MFLVLPAHAPSHWAGTQDSQVLFRHAGGSPWIVGRAGQYASVYGRSDDVQIVVIGASDATGAGLDSLAARTSSLLHLDHITSSVRGAYFLLVAKGDSARAQGSLAGGCELFYHRSAQPGLLSNRAKAIADHSGAKYDKDYFALRLTGALVPPPLDELTAWRDVRSLPGHHFALATGERLSVHPWWRCPEPDVSLKDIAPEVRREVQAAVALRHHAHGGRLSSDLSGGLDSSVLSMVASSLRPDLPTIKWADSDAANTDEYWTARARRKLEGDHVQLGNWLGGRMYSNAAAAASAHLDHPFPSVRTVDRFRVVFEALHSLDGTAHLGGYGGDELFTGPPSYLHEFVRRHPAQARKHVSAFQALRRWKRGDTLRALADRSDLGHQLLREATLVGEGGRSRGHPLPRLGWTAPFRLPPWATEDSRAAVQNLLEQAAEIALPLSPYRSQHTTISSLRLSARMVSAVNQLFGDNMTRELVAPYLDHHVIEAVLSTLPQERGTPFAFKPLLREAFSHELAGLDRIDKGATADETQAGLSAEADSLADLFRSSTLGSSLGLIDDTVVRRHLLDRSRYDDVQGWIDPIISSELFLQSHKENS